MRLRHVKIGPAEKPSRVTTAGIGNTPPSNHYNMGLCHWSPDVSRVLLGQTQHSAWQSAAALALGPVETTG